MAWVVGILGWFYFAVVISATFGEKAGGIYMLVTLVPFWLWVSFKLAQAKWRTDEEYERWRVRKLWQYPNAPAIDLSFDRFLLERRALREKGKDGVI